MTSPAFKVCTEARSRVPLRRSLPFRRFHPHRAGSADALPNYTANRPGASCASGSNRTAHADFSNYASRAAGPHRTNHANCAANSARPHRSHHSVHAQPAGRPSQRHYCAFHSHRHTRAPPFFPPRPASITVAGTASDETGVASVKWSTGTGDSGTAAGAASWSATIRLYTGTNIITVRAYDAAGNSGWRSLTVVKH